ncbi:hypothetical protein CDD83_5668 [Cordyceps sp. RAO-2017]|nr:hypothetical protein CDD83_5668 [Cordyceps sp. RAO-2017]
MSAIVARSPEEPVAPRQPKCTIIYNPGSALQRQLAEKCASALAEDHEAFILRLEDVGSDGAFNSGVCVVLVNFQDLHLCDMTQGEFEKIKLLLTTCLNLIWVCEDPKDEPKAAMCQGLLRTARWERDHDEVNFLTLGIGHPLPRIEVAASEIVRLVRAAFECRGVVPRNAEYVLRNGTLFTNRLFSARGVNRAISRLDEPITEAVPVKDVIEPMRLTSVDPQRSLALQFVPDELASEPLGPREVLIQVHAAGLGRDVVEDVARLIPGQGIGRDCVGIVTGIGSSVEHVAVGHRVMALRTIPSTGSLQSELRTRCEAVCRVPEGVGSLEAATVPYNFVAAHYCLKTIAQLQPGEIIMIKSACQAIGQAAIQLAASQDARLLLTTSSEEERRYLASQYCQDPSSIFLNDHGPSITPQIQTATCGQGVDVYLNCDSVGLSDIDKSHVSAFGRIVDLYGGATASRLSFNALGRGNISYTGVDMDIVVQSRVGLVEEALEHVTAKLAAGRVKPLSDVKEIGISEVSKAIFQFRLESSRHPSMFVVRPRDDEVIPISIRPIGEYRLDPDSSYLLVGGFGGIGRRLALWMQSRGAQNLIFISRSGLSAAPARDLYGTLRNSRGCKVESVACDIADADAVKEALAKVCKTMPPIRGCIQCSMVLQDSMLLNMSHGQFMAAVTPKVAGSINIANNLPAAGLDFFVMLSATAAIFGNRGQANYTAANAFLDAYARQLAARGRPATSVGLGRVLSVGWVAENQERLPMPLACGDIAEDRLLSILEYHMDPRWGAAKAVDSCHTISGLRSATDFERASLPLPPFMAYPLFTHLCASKPETTAETTEATVPIAKLLKTATSKEESLALVTEATIAKVSRVMAVSPKDLESHRTLSSYGVDSLVAVDLKAWFKKELGAVVATRDVLGKLSIQDLAEKIVEISGLLN